jgi:hypothetical protein
MAPVLAPETARDHAGCSLSHWSAITCRLIKP